MAFSDNMQRLPSTSPQVNIFQGFAEQFSFLSIVYTYRDQAKYTISGDPGLRQTRFEQFIAETELNTNQSDYYAWRDEESIFVDLNNETPIRAAVGGFFAQITGAANAQPPLAGNKFVMHRNMSVTGPHFSRRTNFSITSSLRGGKLNLYPNLVGEAHYSTQLQGDNRCHSTMQKYLKNAAVLGGLVVDINPWNFVDHDNNKITLLLYEKGLNQTTNFVPSRAMVLGRAMTDTEINELHTITGVTLNNIHGNGKAEPDGHVPGRCRFDNPNDDNIYTFAIPASVLMVPHQGEMEGHIGATPIDLNNYPAGSLDLIVNCKALVQNIAHAAAVMIPAGFGAFNIAPYLPPIV